MFHQQSTTENRSHTSNDFAGFGSGWAMMERNQDRPQGYTTFPSAERSYENQRPQSCDMNKIGPRW